MALHKLDCAFQYHCACLALTQDPASHLSLRMPTSRGCALHLWTDFLGGTYLHFRELQTPLGTWSLSVSPDPFAYTRSHNSLWLVLLACKT